MLCHCYVFFCRHRHKRFDDSENIAQPFSCYSYCLASAAHSDLLVCFACHNRSQTHRKFLSSSVTPQRYQMCARVACFFRGFAPGSQAGRSICYRDVKTTALCAFLDLASPLDLVSGSCNSCYLLWFGLVVPKRVYVVAVKRLQVPPGETPGRPAISCFFCPLRPFSHIRSFVCFCIGQQSLMYDRMILRRRGRHTTPDPRALFFCPCHVPRCCVIIVVGVMRCCRLAYRMTVDHI